jgi:hypothetical protein
VFALVCIAGEGPGGEVYLSRAVSHDPRLRGQVPHWGHESAHLRAGKWTLALMRGPCMMMLSHCRILTASSQFVPLSAVEFLFIRIKLC